MLSRPLAAIDIGTNTFKLLIAQVIFRPRDNVYSIKEVFSQRAITRLGEGLSRSGSLSKETISKSLSILKEFRSALNQYDVLSVSAVATSALRDALNRDVFLEKARETAGFNIRIISGNEEARKTASGMLIDIPIPDTALMADIGGGSTELIFTIDARPVLVRSIDLGVVHLAARYMKKDPPSASDLHNMNTEITNKILSIATPFIKRINSKTMFIGTAGTVTALGAMVKRLKRYQDCKIHGSVITKSKLDRIYSDISTVNSLDRARMLPFEPSRLDIIVPGTRILQKLMDMFGFSDITVSAYGLRHGVLIDLYKKLADKQNELPCRSSARSLPSLDGRGLRGG